MVPFYFVRNSFEVGSLESSSFNILLFQQTLIYIEFQCWHWRYLFQYNSLYVSIWHKHCWQLGGKNVIAQKYVWSRDRHGPSHSFNLGYSFAVFGYCLCLPAWLWLGVVRLLLYKNGQVLRTCFGQTDMCFGPLACRLLKDRSLRNQFTLTPLCVSLFVFELKKVWYVKFNR